MVLSSPQKCATRQHLLLERSICPETWLCEPQRPILQTYFLVKVEKKTIEDWSFQEATLENFCSNAHFAIGISEWQLLKKKLIKSDWGFANCEHWKILWNTVWCKYSTGKKSCLFWLNYVKKSVNEMEPKNQYHKAIYTPTIEIYTLCSPFLKKFTLNCYDVFAPWTQFFAFSVYFGCALCFTPFPQLLWNPPQVTNACLFSIVNEAT
jgi:hypothetical protein